MVVLLQGSKEILIIFSYATKASPQDWLSGAGSRGRTGTMFYHRGILSPLRLPIPPYRRWNSVNLPFRRGRCQEALFSLRFV